MAVRKAYNGEVTLAFDYKAAPTSNAVRYDIHSERVSFVMIEHKYENQNILPVIYVCLNLTDDIYGIVMNSSETSKFYLKIRKKDALSNTSVYKTVVDDTFSYVTSTFNANYVDGFDAKSENAYKSITIGLVSSNMTNQLRKAYNGIYNNIDSDGLVNIALDGLKNVVKAPLANVDSYKEFMVPPVSSRYKLLEYIFEMSPFYNSNFTFYMDFNKCYLVPKNGEPVSDGDLDTVIINVKDYSASDAYVDGFNIENGAYVVNINSMNTKMIVNNSTSKVTNNIVGYYDEYDEAQDFRVDTEDVQDNTQKTTYVRSKHAGIIKTELESNSVMLELLKQNMDSDIFTPNKSYSVSNYTDYAKYNGKYFLSYKREIYSVSNGGAFNITCTIGLKKAGAEESITAKKNKLPKKSSAASYSATRTTTAASTASTSSTPRVASTSTSKGSNSRNVSAS